MRSWLRPPQFDDPLATQRATVLHSLAIFVLCVAIPVGTFHLFTGQVPLLAVGAYGTLIGLQLVIIALVRARRLTVAAIVYVTVYWCLIATLVLFVGGIGEMHASGLIVVTLLAGLSLGTRGAISVGGLSSVFVLLMAWLEASGRLPRSPMTSGVMEHASSLVSNLLFAATFVFLSMRSLARSMARERAERTQRERRAANDAALGRLGQFAVAATAGAVSDEVVRLLIDLVHANRVLVLEARDGHTTCIASHGAATVELLGVPALAKTHVLESAERPAGFEADPCVVAAPMPGLDGRAGVMFVGLPEDEAELALPFVETVAAMLGAARARDEAAAQLQQAQKMEVVGRLAGGVAHDFNNLLTIIVGCSSILADELAANPDSQSLAKDIEGAAHRAALMTRQLLSVSRRQVDRPERLDLNDVIREFQPMVQRLLRADVAVHVALSPTPARLLADRASLEQVVLNLAVNARDAMKEGGRLTFSTRLLADVTPPQVELRVTDTGHGMDELTRRRIFEPFFTTRADGTGLGLATVKSIVGRRGGTITVDSTLNEGTTFVLTFPAVVEPEAVTPKDEPAPRGHELVLVVDDDEHVGLTTRRLLERAGFRVLSARTARAALELLASHPDIAAVVTDVVMDEMSGPTLGQRIVRERGLPVLYVSGFADAFDPSLGAFLAKPFEGTERVREGRELLDSRRRGATPRAG